MSAPQYIPDTASSLPASKILSPSQAGISGNGTSDSTLQRDFTGVADYLCTITGDCSSSSIVTSDGNYQFGEQYFFNTNNKCTLASDDNVQYCKPGAKTGDLVYEYIYVNTVSDGLLPGIMNNITKMATIPGEMVEVLAGGTGAECQCVTLNVTNASGGTQCSGAFINVNSMNDDDITSNACDSQVVPPSYGQGASSAIKKAASTISKDLDYFGIDAFTTMHKKVDILYFIVLSILGLFILYKILKIN